MKWALVIYVILLQCNEILHVYNFMFGSDKMFIHKNVILTIQLIYTYKTVFYFITKLLCCMTYIFALCVNGLSKVISLPFYQQFQSFALK